MFDIRQEHGSVIQLYLAKQPFKEKRNSLFIFDSNLGMWCLKNEYDELDIKKDNLTSLPMLHPSELDVFGLWKQL